MEQETMTPQELERWAQVINAGLERINDDEIRKLANETINKLWKLAEEVQQQTMREQTKEVMEELSEYILHQEMFLQDDGWDDQEIVVRMNRYDARWLIDRLRRKVEA